MTVEETTKVLAVIKAAYPNFQREQDAEQVIKVWHFVLRDLPYSAASKAVGRYIKEEHFPPVPADIRTRVEEKPPKGMRCLPSPIADRDFETLRLICEKERQKRREHGIPETSTKAQEAGMSYDEWAELNVRAGIWQASDAYE